VIALKKLRGDKLHVCEGGAVKRRTIAHDVNHKCCYCPAARQGPTKDQEVVILGDALADYANAEGGGMLLSPAVTNVLLDLFVMNKTRTFGESMTAPVLAALGRRAGWSHCDVGVHSTASPCCKCPNGPFFTPRAVCHPSIGGQTLTKSILPSFSLATKGSSIETFCSSACFLDRVRSTLIANDRPGVGSAIAHLGKCLQTPNHRQQLDDVGGAMRPWTAAEPPPPDGWLSVTMSQDHLAEIFYVGEGAEAALSRRLVATRWAAGTSAMNVAISTDFDVFDPAALAMYQRATQGVIFTLNPILWGKGIDARNGTTYEAWALKTIAQLRVASGANFVASSSTPVSSYVAGRMRGFLSATQMAAFADEEEFTAKEAAVLKVAAAAVGTSAAGTSAAGTLAAGRTLKTLPPPVAQTPPSEALRPLTSATATESAATGTPATTAAGAAAATRKMGGASAEEDTTRNVQLTGDRVSLVLDHSVFAGGKAQLRKMVAAGKDGNPCLFLHGTDGVGLQGILKDKCVRPTINPIVGQSGVEGVLSGVFSKPALGHSKIRAAAHLAVHKVNRRKAPETDVQSVYIIIMVDRDRKAINTQTILTDSYTFGTEDASGESPMAGPMAALQAKAGRTYRWVTFGNGPVLERIAPAADLLSNGIFEAYYNGLFSHDEGVALAESLKDFVVGGYFVFPVETLKHGHRVLRRSATEADLASARSKKRKLKARSLCD